MTAPVLIAFVISAAFSVLFGVRGRHIVFAGLAGAFADLIYQLALPLGELPPYLLYGAAAALAAELLARLLKAPATLYLAAGLIPMVPGGGLYRGVLLGLEGNPMASVEVLYATLLQVGAIALGLILVSSMLKLLPLYPRRKTGAPPPDGRAMGPNAGEKQNQ